MASQRTSNIAGIVVAIILISSGAVLLVLNQLDFGPGNGTTTTLGPTEDFVPIDELMAATFDGKGFADEPDSSSTISSTLSAIDLLSEFDLISSPITHDMLNDTYNSIMEREHPNGGFQEVVGFADQSLEATALSARTLRLMNRLTQSVISGVRTYLGQTFRGGLSYENWISEGVLMEKYWGLRCAHETDSLGYLGLKPITLDNIFDEGEEPGVGTDPVLWTGEIYYGTALDQKNLVDRLTIFECFEYMIPNPLHRPVIIGLLVNETNSVNQLATMIDESIDQNNIDFEFILTAFRILTNSGNMSLVFEDNIVTERINYFQEKISSVVDIETAKANPNSTISEILAMTKIERLISFNLNHEFIKIPECYCCCKSLVLLVIVKLPFSYT